TRSYGDWSSDVCSSDLGHRGGSIEVEVDHARRVGVVGIEGEVPTAGGREHAARRDVAVMDEELGGVVADGQVKGVEAGGIVDVEIGRASCRERVECGVV